MRRRGVFVGVACVLAMLVSAGQGLAQSSMITGQILGEVIGPDGETLPGVTIEAMNVGTGLTRHAVTGANGAYRFDLLPVGIYDVKSELSGFRTEVQQGLEVTLGSSISLDFTMQIATTPEEITVTAATPVVETTNPSVAATVSEEAIANLPLSGRNFKDFAVLAPGTVASDDSSQTTRYGLNMGARGIQNSFNIDGTNNQSSFFGEERGGTRPAFTFSQAAIKEFQVIKSSYNLQFNSSGGVINAITNAGTNTFEGQVFAYFSDDSMRGRDADGNEADTFEQLQYGFALGGPVVRDRLHFFGSFDAQDFTTPHFPAVGDFPLDRKAEFNAITGLDFDNEVSQMDMTNDAIVFLLKLDWQASQNHLVSVRHNYSDNEALNGLYTRPYPNQWRSLNSTEGNSFHSLVGNLNSVLSDDMFNEVIFQYSAERRPRTPNTTLIPETDIYGYRATFGQKSYLPNKLDEDRYQLIDNFTFFAGDHTIKAGINLDFSHYDNVFLYYSNGYYTFNDWDDFFDGDAGNFRQAFSATDGAIVFDVDYYALYLQDEWRVNPGLTVTYGVRYDLQDNPQPDMVNPAYPISGSIPNDTNNWAPRVGFAWDVAGTGKSVLRGGIGYFYDNTPTLLLSNAMNDNGVRTITLQQRCYRGDECPTYPNTWDSPGDLTGASSPDIKAMDPDFENAETWRVSLGYEQELMRDFSVGVDVLYSESRNLERSQNQNIAPTGGTTVDGLTMYEFTGDFPGVGDINQYTSDVKAEYTSVVLKARKRFSDRWMLNASYTWADAKDNNSNERSTTAYPFDQYDIDVDWGPSDFDHTHKFVVSGSYLLPWDIMISGIFHVRSGFPYTAEGSGWDSNGDGEDEEPALIRNSDGSWFRYARNTFRQPYYRKLDLRLSKTFNLPRDMGLEIIFDVFNVTDAANWYTSNTQLVDWDWDGSDYELEDDFGENNRYGKPRQYQLGLKFRF